MNSEGKRLDKVSSVIPPTTPSIELVTLQAEPEPLEIDLQRTAVIVIDMQNAFVSKGGIVDLWGWDISPKQRIIEPIKKITNAARAKGVKVINVAIIYSPDLSNTGGPDSPNWYKLMLTSYRRHPEWRDKMLVRGTWGSEIIKKLRPQEGDILIEKPKYSAFFQTSLDAILKKCNIKYVLFVGVDTNICVEASIRDAFYLEYFPILISDATVSIGPAFTQEATIFNVESCYGWTTTAENIGKALK